jgi:hypothetical protein
MDGTLILYWDEMSEISWSSASETLSSSPEVATFTMVDERPAFTITVISSGQRRTPEKSGRR